MSTTSSGLNLSFGLISANKRLLKLENGKKFKFDSMKKIEQELVYYGGLIGYLNKKNDYA